jgi:hypothetical protein
MNYFNFFKRSLAAILFFMLAAAGVQAQTTIFSENFDGTPPFQLTSSGTPAWSLNSTVQFSAPNSYANVVSQGDTSFLTTNTINLTGYSFVLLEFYHICKIGFFDAAEIFVSTDDGVTWTKLTNAQYINNNNSQFGTSGDKFTATAYPLLWLPSDATALPTNSWWMMEQFDVSAIAGNQSQVRFRFRLLDGNNLGAQGNAGWFLDDIKVNALSVLHNMELTKIINPTGEFCYNGNVPVSVMIKNIGLDPISGGFTAGYKLGADAPVIEPLSYTLTPGDSIVHQFGTPINFSLLGNDSTMTLKAFVNAPTDPFSQNDTMTEQIKFLFVPPSPIAVHDTVPYGTSATLEAISSGKITWYGSPTSDVVLDTGSVFVTPVLYGNTPYYASSRPGTGGSFIITEIAHYKVATGAPVGGWPSYLLADDYIEITGPPNGDLTGHILEIWTSSALEGARILGAGTVLGPNGTCILATGQLGSSSPSPANYYYHSGHTVTQSSTTAKGYILKKPNGDILDAVVYGNLTFPAASGVTPADWTGTTPALSSSGNRLEGPYTKNSTYWINSGTSPQNPNQVNNNVEVPLSGCESDRTEVWAIVTGNPAVDAGMTSIFEPVSPTNLSPQPVRATIRNYGTDPLTSATIHWTHNGIAQTAFNWTGNLALGQIDSVTIGSVTPVMGNNYLKAWSANPNGIADPMPSNDTTTYVFEAFEPLCGTYTIGGAGSNFASFADALYALDFNGITCPVTFLVQPGTYNERVVLTASINGMSATNTITFQGVGNAVIEYSTAVTGDRAAVLFNGAKHFRFDNISIVIPDASSFGHGIHFTNNAENIQITNCTVTVPGASTSTNYSGIVASGSLTSATTTGNSAHNILIENTTVNGGYYGIIFYGAAATPLNGIVIKNNEINNSYYYSLRPQYTNALIVDGNIIKPRIAGGTTSHYAMYVAYTYEPIEIINNKIDNTGLYGIYVTNVNAPPPGRSLFANNSIGGSTSTGTPYGIYMTASSNIDIIHNSININSGTGRGISTLATATGLRLLNNSFVYSGTGAGYAAYHTSISSVIEQDYNNYYSGGSNFVYYGAARANLAALQAVNQPPGNDVNSVSGDPLYISTTDLLPLGGILNDAGTPFPDVDTDILGNPRDPSTPDIGAYEFTTVNADIGLMEAKLVRGNCLSSNDSIYITLKNVIGPAVDLSGDPVYATYDISGPVSATNMLVINSGILNPNQELEFGFDGIDMSLPGTYVLSVYIEPGASNLMSINDTLTNTFQISVPDETFDAIPDYVLITNSVDSVALTVNSNLFPLSNAFFITEICTFRGSTTGAPPGGWPPYMIADDYIEVTGAPGFDLGGYTLEIWTTTALSGSQILAPGTVIGPSGTCIIAVGQLSSSVPSPANYYYHSGHTATLSSTTNYGFIFRDGNGNIVDAVAYGNYTFLPAANVTPADWTGTTVNASSAGIRLVGPYTKDGTNWINSNVSPQNPNALNPGVSIPQAASLADFSWSLDGVITSVNNIDTVVGPWTQNGIYQYVASYLSPCGLKTDTVTIEVGVPTHDLRIAEIITPTDDVCTGNDEYVTIRIANFGIDTLFGGFTASYQIEDDIPVTENVNLNVPPAGSVIYQFTTPINFGTGILDTTFYLKTWATAATDPYHFNDTLGQMTTFNYYPDLPIAQDDTINYGMSASLNAFSNAQIFWYEDTISQIQLATGNPFITPPLFQTTTYYASASLGLGINDSLQTIFTGGNGCGGGAMFNVKALNSDLIIKGFTIVTNSSNAAMPVKVYVKSGSYLGSETNPSAWTQIGGIYTVSATIDVPVYFACDDIVLLNGQDYAIYIEYSARYTNITAATTYSNAHLQIVGGAGLCSSFGGLNALRMFNGKVHYTSAGSGCSTPRVPVIAHVILPAVDVLVTEIITPVHEQCSDNADIVSVKITNNGYDTITSGLTASYRINLATPITESVSTVLPPGDTIVYQFTTPISLNLTTGDSTFTLKAWATHPLDMYHLNDTSQSIIKLSFTPPTPIVVNDTIPYATSATLQANAPGLISWYPSPTSDILLDTGNVYVTPVLYGSTPYYVAASEGTGSAYVGMVSSTNGTSGAGVNTYGLYFDALSAFTLKSVAVYPNSTANNTPGTLTISVIDPGGAILHQAIVNVTGFVQSTTPTFERVDLNFNIQPANNLRLVLTAKSSSISGVMFQPSAQGPYPYPYTLPGIVSITSGTYTSQIFPSLYYYFYNWEVGSGSGCESPRAEVWAIVDPTTLPALDAGVVSIDSPVSPANLSPQQVEVTIRNYGQNPLTSVNVMWSINGIAQPTYNWTGNLATGAMQNNINIGTASFFLGQNTVKVWTSMPNGFADLYPVNDTATAVINAFDPLCGTFTLGGPTSDFPDFATAMYALYEYGVTCPVVFELMLPVFNETLVFDSIPGSSAVNTVTFRPGPGMNVEITSASTTATMKFNAAKNIIFDGFSGSGSVTRNLTISNTGTGTNSAVVWISSSGATLNQGCRNITIKNCNIEGASNSVTSSFGIYIGGTTITTTGTGNHNNSIILLNNHITKSYIAIYSRSVSPNFNTGLTIEKNIIGSSDPLQYVTFKGIDLQGATNPLITGNHIYNLIVTTSVNNAGIDIGQNVSGAQIIKNNIHTLRSLSTGGYGAYGINIATATGVSNILIANNFISDIVTVKYSATSTTWNPFGIRIVGGANIRIYNNSINLFGEPTLGSSASMSACLLVTAAVTGLDVRNNIFANSMTGNTGSKSYCVYKVTAVTFTTSNYNDYYPSGPFGLFGYSGSGDVSTLAAWRTLTGQDVNSISENPNFFTDINLHTFSASVNNIAQPLAEVPDDIDGDLRHPTTPDMGADEFDPVAKDAAVVAGLSPLSGCGLTSTETIIVRLKNSGLDTIYTMNVSYSINGGLPVNEIWNGALATNQTVDYTFTQTADLSALGTYHIFFEVDLVGDALALNDTLTYVIKSSHDFYASDYFMGFEPGEDYSKWVVVDVNSDGRTWEPGYNSTTYARTGSRSARFFNGSTNPGNDYLFTECFTLDAGVAYKVEFWYRVESATYAQNIRLVASTGVTPVTVTDTLVNLPLFNNTTYQLASGIFTAPTTGVYHFGWHAYSPAANFYSYIDDINIRILAPLDAGVISVNNINDMENGGSSKNIQVTLKNFGSQTLTSVPVSFTINGGTPVTETWTGSMQADSTSQYTFATPYIVPDGDYTVCVYTELAGDGNPGNDQTCVNKFGLPVFTVPYSDDFESVSYWYTEGATTQWQLGQPSASIINSAHSPVKAWATQLNGNYANNSSYYLYSPKFNFSQTQNMVLGFWHWYETENGVDGGKVQYTTNNGMTWTTLGVLNDPNGANWYNSANINNAPGFSGSSQGWQYSEISLSALNLFPIPVQFRFHFFSNATVANNGWAIDDIVIYQPQIPNDAGVIEIVAPAGQSVTGSPNQVTVKLKNFGTQTLTSIPVSYRVMGGPPPINATWTGTLTPGSETNFTFPTPFIGPFSDFTLCSWTSLTGDIYKFNDTTCVDLTPGPANVDGSVIEILSPVGETMAGTNVTVSIRVKNMGAQPLVNIPVQYFVDNVPTATESVIGTLNPGAETDYTFITTFVSPSSDYELCAKTSISGDAVISNDELCRDLTTGIAETELNGIRLLQNIPNPANEETVIGFSLPTGGKLVLTITNVLGEVIYSEAGEYAAGMHNVLLNTKSMAAGVYSYSITFDQQKLTRKMIVQ